VGGPAADPALIAVRAVELTLCLTLLSDPSRSSGARSGHPRAACSRRRARIAGALFPLVLGIFAFAGARVAQTLVARGLGPALALAVGLDLTLRRGPSLTRLALGLAWRTLPLTLGALLSGSSPGPAPARHRPGTHPRRPVGTGHALGLGRTRQLRRPRPRLSTG